MKNINVGQALSTLANLGVVAGLVLLALEINQANRQAEAGAYQQRMTEIEHARQQFALSDTLPAIYVKIRESGLESLTNEERTRVVSWENARLRRLQAQWYQYTTGFTDRATYESGLEFAARLQNFWQKLGVTVPDAAFRAEIETMLPAVDQIMVPEVDW